MFYSFSLILSAVTGCCQTHLWANKRNKNAGQSATFIPFNRDKHKALVLLSVSVRDAIYTSTNSEHFLLIKWISKSFDYWLIVGVVYPCVFVYPWLFVLSADVCLSVSRHQVMWTGLPCQNFHLLVCCAILDSEKQKIMEENYGFNEILKVRLCSWFRISPLLLVLTLVSCWLPIQHMIPNCPA